MTPDSIKQANDELIYNAIWAVRSGEPPTQEPEPEIEPEFQCHECGKFKGDGNSNRLYCRPCLVIRRRAASKKCYRRKHRPAATIVSADTQRRFKAIAASLGISWSKASLLAGLSEERFRKLHQVHKRRGWVSIRNANYNKLIAWINLHRAHLVQRAPRGKR